MLNHIYRCKIRVLGHTPAILSSWYIHPAQGNALRNSLIRPVVGNLIIQVAPSTPVRYKSATTPAKPQCSHPGCTTSVHSRGLCQRHRYPCAIQGCEKGARVGGYCIAHAKEHDQDAYDILRSRDKRCAIDDCDKHAIAGGYCKEHAKDHDPDAYNMLRSDQSCILEGCSKQAKAGGYCSEHAQQYDPNAYKEYRNRINRIWRDRYRNNPDFKLTSNLRSSNWGALKKAGISNKGKLENLGCPVSQFHQYFEQNHFQEEGNEWMNWDNRGGGRCTVNQSWEKDHVMPVSSFVLSDPEQRKRCFHWSNMQPLKWQDNVHKSGKVPKDFEWCSEKERWLWGEASGKINYKLPPTEDDDFNGGDDKE